MLELPHVAVGAAIATKVVNPFLALPLALTSHYLLDKTPHWNPHLNEDLKKQGKVSMKSNALNLVDSTSALILGTFIATKFLPDYKKTFIIITCCFLAVLPDVIKIPFYYFKSDNKSLTRFIKWDKSIQNDTNPFYGLLTQVIITTASLYWIFS